MTQNVSKRDYVAKLKELDLDDPNFDEKFNHINNSYSSKTHLEHRVPYNDLFGDPFRELTQIHNTINNMMNRFKNKFDINNENEQGKERSYYKYVSSMTTYDNNGVRKAKSISRSEKYDGKTKKVTQVSRYQDGDKYVEEYLQPDGSVKKIEKTVNKYLDL